ncbi:hypothetical protein Q0Z83_102420 [Actinoplanes sichuanensis]|uniref:Uncharacterized protein n=1 Tax=Actinoplanes sichuanensis TaxID=512349 RepID=A0ABW4AII0_9ACTN|nr:hypothetical protein [Actinoplanes sichuanensis]BEL12051.1 hypothetical protein Q0Z83_102420 [Actinoplanes sichuanensis]
MDRIPQDVTEAVRVAATAARGYPGDLADVHRRARRRRNRQVALSAVAVVAVAAGAGVGAGQWRQPPPPLPAAATSAPAPVVSPTTAPAVAQPVQPLILDDAVGTYRAPGGGTVELGGDSRIGELLPDGTITTHEVVGSAGWERLIVLPDGSQVAFGSHDLKPGDKRVDGPNVTDLEYRLVVTGPDGKVRVQRDVRRMGESVILVAATETTAYLWRPAGLVLHDLATGKEELVVGGVRLGLGKVFGDLRLTDMQGGWLAVARMQDECVPRVYDVTTGRLIAKLSLTGSRCIAVSDIRLAPISTPESALVAVAYQRESADHLLETRVALIEVVTGRRLTDYEVPPASPKAALGISLAWQDGDTLRGAAYPVAPEGTGEMNGFTVNAK